MAVLLLMPAGRRCFQAHVSDHGYAGMREIEAQIGRYVIHVVAVEPAGEYRLRLRFSDDTVQTVDFFPFLSHSRHPDIRAFLDRKRFADFRLEYGDLVWGNYELCFPMMDLYKNEIGHPTSGFLRW